MTDATAPPGPPAHPSADLSTGAAAGPAAGNRAVPDTGRGSRVAVVTGAGRGIGRELALGLAAAGWDVGLVGRRREALDDVAAECVRVAGGRAGGGPAGGGRAEGGPARGGRAEGGTAGGGRAVRTAVVTADLAVPDDARRAVAELAGALGDPHLLVNNAGVIERREVPFGEDDPEDLWRVIETNVRGPLLVTHAALPGLLATGGRVVNVNSGSAYRRGGAYTGYGMSKGALARFTDLLDHQYRDQGLRVLDLAPGVVVTDMTRSMPAHDDRTEWTEPADVVALVLAFAEGRLDALSGRLVRAGTDTVESLLADAEAIVAADARVVRLVPIRPGDPVA